jgi:phosphopantothenoylcysteine decarboxylase
MANVLLGVTGSVAAVKTPELYAHLQRNGHAVKVVVTSAALYFFDPLELSPREVGGRRERNPDAVVLDEDEWPGRDEGTRYQRSDSVLHIELRRWADLLAVAPLDANTLAKLAGGLADNCLTCVWRAWEPGRPVLLAPAMNTLMWRHPATARHLRQLAADAGAPGAPLHLSDEELIDWINRCCPRLRVAAPIEKRLACDDVGVGAMAEVKSIGALVEALLANPTGERGASAPR